MFKIKNHINDKLKKKILFIPVFILLLVAGFLFGRLIGFHIISGLFKGSKKAVLLPMPPFEYIKTANLINSSEELKRLEGYYSLLDKNMIDTDLLIDRYKEESELIKSTIIWIFGYSKDKNNVLGFLSEEYKKSNKSIQVSQDQSVL